MSQRIGNNPLVSFIDQCMRGIGQISIMNNPLTGLLIIASIAIAEPRHGLAMLVGVVIATGTAHVSKLDRDAIRGGLFGFNGALVGAGLNIFLDPAQYWLILVYVALGAAISVPVMAALMAWLGSSSNGTIAPLTFPFNIVTLMALLGLQLVRYSALPQDTEPDAERLTGEVNAAIRGEADAEALDFSFLLILQILLRGISQLFLVENARVGLVVLIAITLCSRISAVAAILGSGVGTLTAMALGADGYSVYLGLFGYNGFVTAIAIAGVFVRYSFKSLVLGTLAAGLTSLFALGLQSSFDVVGIPILTLPFCFVTVAIILFTKMSNMFEVVEITAVTRPEDHRERDIEDNTR